MLDFSTTRGTLASINMTTAWTSSQSPRPILAPDQWSSVAFPGFPLPPPISTSWPLPQPRHADPGQSPGKSRIQSMLSFYSTDLGSEFLLLAHKSGTYTLLARTETLTSKGTLYRSGWWLVSRFVLAHVLAATAPAASTPPTPAMTTLTASAMDVTTLPMGARFPNGVWAVHVKRHPETHRPGYWLLPLEQLLGALDLAVLNNVSPLPPADVTVVGELPMVSRGRPPQECRCKSAGHGVCVDVVGGGLARPTTTACECYEGFSGPDCSLPAATCHAPNATVVAPGACACPPGWSGMHCDHVSVPANRTLVPQLRHAGDNDDAAIYVHPTNPRAAVALGTTKSHKDKGEGGVHVWLLESGKEVGFVEVPSGAGVNSINLVYGVAVEDDRYQEKVDLVVASVRGSVNGIAVWKIDPQALLVAANLTSPPSNTTAPANNNTDNPLVLTPLSSHILPLDPTSIQVYGSCAFSYLSASTIRHSVVLPTKQGRAHQFHLALQANKTHATAPPIPHLTPVRSWRVGRGSQLENCQADAEQGVLYVGEEGVGVWAHDLRANAAVAEKGEGGFEWKGLGKWPPTLGTSSSEPSSAVDWPRLIDATVNAGAPGGTLRMDIEGLGLYVTPKRKRKLLVVSSQGQNAFVVYDVTRVRSGPTPRLVSIRVTQGGDGVDEVTKTDSLSVTSASVGGFASGALVVHDDATTEAGDVSKVSREATFKVVDWEEIAKRVKERVSGLDLLN